MFLGNPQYLLDMGRGGRGTVFSRMSEWMVFSKLGTHPSPAMNWLCMILGMYFRMTKPSH